MTSFDPSVDCKGRLDQAGTYLEHAMIFHDKPCPGCGCCGTLDGQLLACSIESDQECTEPSCREGVQGSQQALFVVENTRHETVVRIVQAMHGVVIN